MLQRFDELNTLVTAIKQIDMTAKLEGIKPKLNADRCCDEILDILLICWAMGNHDANEQIGAEIEVESERVFEDIYHEIDGLTFEDRAREHISNSDLAALVTLIETESTHDYNSGVLTTGMASGLRLMKRWNTQMDDRVRDSHSYLQSTVVPIDAEFYTYGGAHALYPTGFGDPAEDCGCRCYLTLETI